ncbi:exo-alpha-sialidase [Streptomyces sp. NPDC090025]|uniref:sialidase family protein n=1 Tax=Streptomyces sp. NPDC090025 TaxID=3365922 RepID=UPI003832E29C
MRWGRWGYAAVVAALVAGVAVTDVPVGHGRSTARLGCAGSVPYRAGTGGYAAYRIPAVVRTPAGTLLAFAEGRRHGAGDSGDVDLVLRRSADGGCTWGPLAVVAAGRGHTRGNPAPVVDPRSGDVVLLSSGNDGAVTERMILQGRVGADRGRRVYVQRSADDGRSFSPPEDITAAAKLPGWRWYATGPGHAVVLTRGRYAGRLVVPADHSTAPPPGSRDTGREPRYYGAHALVSDDGGRTWRIGFVDDAPEGSVNGNESTAAELPDGSLYFSTRDQLGSAPGNRADARSYDGGATLDRPYAPQPALAAVPVVQGSLLAVPGTASASASASGDGLLLFSAPSVPDRRAAAALWTSTDGGRTLTRALTLSTDPAAYSDLVAVGDDTIGVLYETGRRSPYETITFRRVPLARLAARAAGR